MESERIYASTSHLENVNQFPQLSRAHTPKTGPRFRGSFSTEWISISYHYQTMIGADL